MNKSKFKLSKKSNALIISFAIVIILFIVFLIYCNGVVNKWGDAVYPGVMVGDTEVSGKTLDETKAIIQKEYGDNLWKKTISVKTNEKIYSLDYSKLNAKYDIDEAASKAYDYGKNDNVFKRFMYIKKPTAKMVELKFSYDEGPIKELIGKIKKDVDKPCVESSVVLVDGNFKIKSSENGYKLKEQELEQALKAAVNGDIKESEKNIDAPIESIVPTVSEEQLKTINTKIASFTSNFSTSSDARSNNITRATNSINGKCIMPGGKFSFNEVVGIRTAARGYMKAPVIVGTKVEEDYGGGICQVSTTLYNAVIRSNIEATERAPHTLPSHYMGPAMDATVDWGNIDYKFVNTLSYPIYIEAYVKNKNIYFNVYSNSSLTNRTYDMVNEIYAKISAGVTYKDDATLLEGQQVVEQPASQGIKAKAFKNTYENGKIIEHKQIADDYYKPVNAVIRRGTKKPEAAPVVQTPQVPQPVTP